MARTTTDMKSRNSTLEPDERIIWVAVGAGWMIDSLTFKTNKERQFGRYGGTGGSLYPLEPPCKIGGFLAFLEGRVDVTQGATAVRCLKINWGYSDSDWNDSSHELDNEYDDYDHMGSDSDANSYGSASEGADSIDYDMGGDDDDYVGDDDV